MTLTIGELCAGYGGLGAAVEEVFGARLAWVSEYEAAPSKILAHHWPHVPNLGDMTRIDWAAVEPVDIISGGTPCQDLSHAGKRAGMTEGTRSNLWVQMREAIATIRPRFVVWENVRGAYSAAADSDVEPCPGCVGDGSAVNLRALGRVLGDLADLGYDAGWHGLTAASVGAPHGRFRVFVLAWLADPSGVAGGFGNRNDVRAGRGAVGRGQAAGSSSATDADSLGCERCGCSWNGRHGSADIGELAADADDSGLEGCRAERSGAASPLPADHRPASDTQGDGRHKGRPESAGLVGGSNAAVGGDAAAADANGRGCEVGSELDGGTSQDPAHRGSRGQHADGHSGAAVGINWGQYAPAIARWESVLGRPAPAPTELSARGSQRLSPRFVEFMMGLPAGHVTDVPGISRNDQLKALGNGVVPAQAAAALRHILAAITQELAA